MTWNPVYQKRIKCPYVNRPWMNEEGAAAPSLNQTLRGAVAGGITGGIEVCITYPTEYVKTQLQLDEKGDRKKYEGIVDCIKKTVKQYGFFGLYRGLSILIYGSIPKSGVRFGGFETFKSFQEDEKGNLGPAGRALSGLGAGVCEAIFAVTPMETIKVKFINDRRSPNPRFKGFLHGVRLIIKDSGFGGIYKGVTATIIKQGTNQMIRFFTMETLKNWWREGDPKAYVPKYMIVIFGAVAGAASVYGNNPVDVVKTRMQGLEAHLYKNTVDCFLKILKNEGITAFYKGSVPRLCRVCLDVAITFTLYDTIMEQFNKFWPKD